MQNAAPNQRKAKKIKVLDIKKRPHSIQQLDNSWTVTYQNNPTNAQNNPIGAQNIQQNAQNIQQTPSFEINPIQQLDLLDSNNIQHLDGLYPTNKSAQNSIQHLDGEFEPVLDVELTMPTVSFIKLIGENKNKRRSVSNQRGLLYKQMKDELNPEKKKQMAVKIQQLDSKFNELIAAANKLENEMQKK